MTFLLFQINWKITSMIEFILNNQYIQTNQSAGSTALDFVRYHRHLYGTKIGCREGDCGACTVLVGELRQGKLRYQSMTSCLMPLGNANGKHLVTIEGLNMENLSPVQASIVEEGGTQCGFCTVGFVMSLTGFLLDEKAPTFVEAVAAMDGNICRCTGYKSLERAAATLVEQLKNRPKKRIVEWLVENHFLPVCFLGIEERLKQLPDVQPAGIQPNGQFVFLGGGTDLFVQRAEEMPESNSQHLFDWQDLKGIYERNGNCYIGASSTVGDLQQSLLLQRIFPRLGAFLKLVSSTPIRNMGTLAGNLANASPIGDLTIFFLALDSTLVLNHFGESRTLPLRHFYKSYKKTDLKKGEYIESLYFKIPESQDFFNFEKVSKRIHLDIASVNSACLLNVKNGLIKKAYLSTGGVGPIPFYLGRSSAALEGKPVNEETLKAVNEVIQEEISPISDARGSADYKRLLLRQLFYAHFLKWFPGLIDLEELVSKS